MPERRGGRLRQSAYACIIKGLQVRLRFVRLHPLQVVAVCEPGAGRAHPADDRRRPIAPGAVPVFGPRKLDAFHRR
jgi:hypothetical protein